jgi:hypothetical protein
LLRSTAESAKQSTRLTYTVSFPLLTPDLTQPIDVYCEWIDAAEDIMKEEEENQEENEEVEGIIDDEEPAEEFVKKEFVAKAKPEPVEDSD